MSDPSVGIEVITERCVPVLTLKNDIYERLKAFSSFRGCQFYHWTGSGTDALVDSISELNPPFCIVSYDGSEYDYDPMAARTFSIYVGVTSTHQFSKDFTRDPADALREAVITALDKYIPRDQCRISVTADEPIEASSETAVYRINILCEDN